MSEVRRQQKRIEHLAVTVGKQPTVLDVEPANWDAIRRSEFSERGFMNSFEPIDRKSLDTRRAELLQQLLDTFKEKKDE